MQPLDPDVESLLRQWIEKLRPIWKWRKRMSAEAADNLRIRKSSASIAGGPPKKF